MVCVGPCEQVSCLLIFLVPSRSSSTPLYPQSAMSQGTCPSSLFFYCFHFRLTFESIKELGGASLTPTKWLWNPHVKKLDKNTMRMSVHWFIKQMKRNDLKNRPKTIIFEKWLIMTWNWRGYKHPPTTPPNLGVDLTSFKCHEPLSHIRKKLLHQTDED